MKNKSYILSLIVTILVACGGNGKISQRKPLLSESLIEEGGDIISELPEKLPKIGISFGGGGAKAAAEIGALKVIEEAGLPIKYVAGSSMGSLIGGLYAAGYTAKEIESLLMAEEWMSLFDKNELGITVENYERTIFGLIEGEVFEEQLRAILAKKGCSQIEDTERITGIKFSCTATRIIEKEHLEEVHLSSGDMAKAIRASLTYPAPIVGFKPVEYDNMLLVDGGMLNNLPVDVVRELGAESVIAIDLELERNKEKLIDAPKLLETLGVKIPLKSLLGIEWLVDWLKKHPEKWKHDSNCDDADILIHPDLLGYSILSFNEPDFRDMITLGEDAAKKEWEKLHSLKNK